MSRRQPAPKPTSIKCATCGKEVAYEKRFSMYEFDCCSNACIEPHHKKRQAEKDESERESESKRRRVSAFPLNMGGDRAY